jgi:hypothetical protein
MGDLDATDLDRRIWQEELADFVPDQVFDVHSHIYRWAFNLDPDKETGPMAGSIGAHFPEVTWELADKVDEILMPGRHVERLAFPFPFPKPCDFEASNNYVAREVAKGRSSAGLMLVEPEMSAGYLEATLPYGPDRLQALSLLFGDRRCCRGADHRSSARAPDRCGRSLRAHHHDASLQARCHRRSREYR